jgi:hypothetical protein
MHSASGEFVASITTDHHVVETVEFVYAEGDIGPVFDVVDGDYQIDAGADVRHNASFRLVSETATVSELRDALASPGTEVRYSRGMRLSDGTVEVKRMLTGVIATGSVKLSRSGIDPLPVTVFDSYTGLQWASTYAFAVPAAQNYASAIREVISRFAPRVRWGDLMSTQFTTPPLAFATQTQIAEVVSDMAKSIGAEIFFDAFNALNVAPIPVTTGRPVSWTFNLDEPSTGVLDARVETNYDKMPNAVIVVGQHSSGGTVIGEAYDTNPASRTFWGGDYPRRPLHIHTEKAISQAQCRTMARGILEKLLGGSMEIVLNIIPNPLLVLGDVCMVHSDRYGIHEEFVVQAMTGSAGRENIGSPMNARLRRGVNAEDVEI